MREARTRFVRFRGDAAPGVPPVGRRASFPGGDLSPEDRSTMPHNPRDVAVSTGAPFT